jgi:hypothetical protein
MTNFYKYILTTDYINVTIKIVHNYLLRKINFFLIELFWGLTYFNDII